MGQIRTVMKKKDHTFNNKVESFCENIVVIEKEWFNSMNLIEGTTFPTDLTKREKHIFNKCFSCGKKQPIREISINNVGTHILSVYCMRNIMEIFI